jgi:SH3-like domain-containing protein
MLLVGGLASVGAAAPRQMSIQVRDGVIRTTPTFLGKVLEKVSYGDRVSVLDEKSGWSKVQVAGATGWIHTSALTKKKIVLKGGDEDARVAASSDELALAGKGFNSDVEAEFKAENKDIDFTWVDRMEEIKVDPALMVKFLEEGGVEPKGGAQ